VASFINNFSKVFSCLQVLTLMKDKGQGCPLLVFLYDAKTTKQEVNPMPSYPLEEEFIKQSYKSALFYAVKRVITNLNAVISDLNLINFYKEQLRELEKKGGGESESGGQEGNRE
jgi:hypothetical protein